MGDRRLRKFSSLMERGFARRDSNLRWKGVRMAELEMTQLIYRYTSEIQKNRSTLLFSIRLKALEDEISHTKDQGIDIRTYQKHVY